MSDQNLTPENNPQPQAPEEARPRKKSRFMPVAIGLVLFGLILITAIGGLAIILAASASSSVSSASTGGMFSRDRVALLEIEGVLGEGDMYGADTAWLKQQVKDWTEDSRIRGMVIRVNSPGGAVSATQDLVQAIEEFRATNRRVYVSMGDIAASGGYYVALPADRVWANTGTLTGSIGVIFSMWGYHELTEKIGLEPRVIKSGEFKDVGSGSRPMEDDERELLETMIMDVYDQFFTDVFAARQGAAREALARQRGVAPETLTDAQVEAHVRTYADGRIFSGRQALNYGFVDELGTLDDVMAAMKSDLGLSEDARVQPTRQKPRRGLFGRVNRTLDNIERAIPGNARLEFRFVM